MEKEVLAEMNRRRAQGATCRGEILAAGQVTAQRAVDGWMGSTTGHCEGVMNGPANETGVGYAYVQGSTFGHYWTGKLGYRP
ncbi:MAG: CAP domain-containing protein [Bradymonadaceae bacterium]